MAFSKVQAHICWHLCHFKHQSNLLHGNESLQCHMNAYIRGRKKNTKLLKTRKTSRMACTQKGQRRSRSTVGGKKRSEKFWVTSGVRWKQRRDRIGRRREPSRVAACINMNKLVVEALWCPTCAGTFLTHVQDLSLVYNFTKMRTRIYTNVSWTHHKELFCWLYKLRANWSGH